MFPLRRQKCHGVREYQPAPRGAGNVPTRRTFRNCSELKLQRRSFTLNFPDSPPVRSRSVPRGQLSAGSHQTPPATPQMQTAPIPHPSIAAHTRPDHPRQTSAAQLESTSTTESAADFPAGEFASRESAARETSRTMSVASTATSAGLAHESAPRWRW